MLENYVGDARATQIESFEASPANIEMRTQRFSFSEGLRAAVLPKQTRGQVVTARLDLKYGSLRSLQGKGLISSVIASLLDKGTAQRTRQQLQDDLDELKAALDIRADVDRASIFIKTTRENLPAIIGVVAQMVREPVFRQESLDEVRGLALAGIEEARKEPEAQVNLEIERRFNPYPPGDARYVEGFDEQVARLNAIKLEDLRTFHQRFYSVSNAEFSAVGDMDVAAVKAALEAAFGGWRGSEGYERIPHPPVIVPSGPIAVKTPDKQNAYLRAAQVLPLTDSHPDYAAFMMANYLLGQGGNSRLWRRLREMEGLSYDVHSFVEWNPWEANSLWTATAIFAPQNLQKIESGLRQEIARVVKEGFTSARA